MRIAKNAGKLKNKTKCLEDCAIFKILRLHTDVLSQLRSRDF